MGRLWAAGATALAAAFLPASLGERVGVQLTDDLDARESMASGVGHDDAAASDAELFSWSSSGLGAEMSALLSASDRFLASPGMRQHLRAARQMSLAAGLEGLGLPVELRFKRHLMRHILRRALNAKPQVDTEDGSGPSLAQLAEHEGGFDGLIEDARAGEANASRIRPGWSAKKMWKKAARMVQMVNLAADEHTNVCTALGITWEFQDMEAPWDHGSHQDNRYRQAMKNYCVLQKIVTEDGKETDRGVTDPDGHFALHEIQPAGRPNTPEELGKWGPQTVEQKRLWRKLQALRQVRWFSPGNVSDVELEKIRRLYSKTMVINQRISALGELIKQTDSYNWMEVEEKQPGTGAAIGRVGSKVARWTLGYLAKIGENLLAFFENIWKGFWRSLENAERACKQRSNKISEDSAKQANVKMPSDSGSESSVNDFINKVEKMNTVSKLETEAGKLDTALEIAESKGGEDVDEDHMREDVAAIKAEHEEVEAIVKGAGGTKRTMDEHPQHVLQKMDETDAKVGSVEGGFCGMSIKKAASSFKSAFRKIKNAIVAGLETPFPLYGIRGVAGSAGVFAAGFEEVVDFRNREIGQFKWGSAFYGTSSTGAGIGGYAGLGWKGYKENWTLEEGYQTGLWVAKGLDLKFMGLPVGFGVTFGTDADNSQPGPWIPEPHGINAINFGWSMSASLSNLVVPLKVDIGASYYWMLNTECYKGLREFLTYIWWPSCRLYEEGPNGRGGCYPGVERAAVSLLRTGIHAATPIVPDLAFTLLASLYHLVREDSYEPRCSDQSTDNRNNIHHFSVQTGKLIYESVKAMDGLDAEAEQVYSRIMSAKVFNDHDIEKSAEFEEWKGKVHAVVETCPKAPPDVDGEDTLTRTLEDQPEPQLIDLCHELGLGHKCVNPTKKKKRILRLVMAIELLSGDVSTKELDALIAAIPQSPTWGVLTRSSTSKFRVRDGLAGFRGNCTDPESCVKGSDVWKLLKTLGTATLRTLCETVGADCQKDTNWGFSSKFFDDEMMAMKIVDAIGGGTTDHASASNPFGTCSTSEDCPLAHTECPTQSSLEHRGRGPRCQCVASFCYSHHHNVPSNLAPNETEVASCRPVDETSKGLIKKIRVQYKQYKIQIGQLVGELMRLAPGAPQAGTAPEAPQAGVGPS